MDGRFAVRQPQFKPCDRVVSGSGRPGKVQHPWVWNAIEIPGYCLVLFEGNSMPRWMRIDQLLPHPSQLDEAADADQATAQR